MTWQVVTLVLGLVTIACITYYCIVNRICTYRLNKYNKEICDLLKELKK